MQQINSTNLIIIIKITIAFKLIYITLICTDIQYNAVQPFVIRGLLINWFIYIRYLYV